MGASDKMQATSIAKKNGGEAAGYFVVANKNALKARRALEKFKGDFTDPKLKDMMADLFYESVEEEMNEKKVNISAATEELFFLWDEIVGDNRAGIESGETEHKGKSAVLFMTDTDDLVNLAKWKQEAGDYIKKNGLNYKDAGNNFIIHA
jgi:hypothetical protein